MKLLLMITSFLPIVITLRITKDIIASLLTFPEKKIIPNRNIHTPYIGINKKAWENILNSKNRYYYKDPFPYYGPPVTFEKIIENKNKVFISPVLVRGSFQPKPIIMYNTTIQNKSIPIINNNITKNLTLDKNKEITILNEKKGNKDSSTNTPKEIFIQPKAQVLSYIPLYRTNEENKRNKEEIKENNEIENNSNNEEDDNENDNDIDDNIDE